MGRFTKWLVGYNPRTGRMIKEDGEFFNEADHWKLKQDEELSSQSLLGKAFAASWKGTLAATGGTVDLVLDIPPGVLLRLHNRQQSIVGGNLDIDLYVGADGFTAAQTLPGCNLDETVGTESQASIVETTAPVSNPGLELRRQEQLASPGTGSNRSSAFSSSGDAIPTYTSDSKPMLRLTNNGNQQASVIIAAAWAEEDIS